MGYISFFSAPIQDWGRIGPGHIKVGMRQIGYFLLFSVPWSRTRACTRRSRANGLFSIYFQFETRAVPDSIKVGAWQTGFMKASCRANLLFFSKYSGFIIMMQLALQPHFHQQVTHEKLGITDTMTILFLFFLCSQRKRSQ